MSNSKMNFANSNMSFLNSNMSVSFSGDKKPPTDVSALTDSNLNEHKPESKPEQAQTKPEMVNPNSPPTDPWSNFVDAFLRQELVPVLQQAAERLDRRSAKTLESVYK
jgi:hypothetical protein